MTRYASQEDLHYFPDLARYEKVVLWRGWIDAPPINGEPYICDIRTMDTTSTIVAAIRNAIPGMVAITLAIRVGPMMATASYVNAVQAAARARGAEVLWWDGPDE